MIQRIVELPKRRSYFLLGPRQTGKSTLIENLYKEKSWKRDLLLSDIFFGYARDPSLFRKEAVQKIEKEKIQTIILDEVQRLPELLNEVQYLMGKYPSCQFVLTGSSARKLRKGGANMLAGRALDYALFPCVYEEIKDLAELDEILLYGTLPVILDMRDHERIETLSAYVNIYLKEEIQQEGLVRNLPGFTRFLDMAASQCGEQLNYTAISRECQIPARSVQSYYDILEDTLIGFRLPSWRRSVRKQMSTHPKFYFFDTGVTNALTRNLGSGLDMGLKGKLFEQWIILESHRLLRYFHRQVGLYYWRTSNGAEVDLILERSGKPFAAIEIKSSRVISTAHLRGLRSFRDEYPEMSRYLVCDVENTYELDGVRILPWRTYLKYVKEGAL